MNHPNAQRPADLGLIKEADLWPKRDEPGVRTELAGRFLAYAKSIALRYRGQAENLEDLVQVASVGLMNAIDRYDPARGIPFVGFASPTIHGELKRHFRDRVSAMRVPRSVYDRIGQMDSIVADLRTGLAHEPTFDEIAKAMGCSSEEVREAQRATRTRNPVGFGGGVDVDEGVIEEHVGFEDEEFIKTEDRIVTREAFDNLDEADRNLILLRFRDELTQTQIADRLGCSQMQVSRKIRAVLDRMNESILSLPGT